MPTYNQFLKNAGQPPSAQPRTENGLIFIEVCSKLNTPFSRVSTVDFEQVNISRISICL